MSYYRYTRPAETARIGVPTDQAGGNSFCTLDGRCPAHQRGTGPIVANISKKGGLSLIRLALFEPDIPQNTGTILRLGACFGTPVDIIEPAGFPWSERHFRRAGMDYLDHVDLVRHVSFAQFTKTIRSEGRRLVLATTKAALPYSDFAYSGDDTLLFGRESRGVPDEVHAAADSRVLIPMRPGLRSMNIAVAAAIVLSEGLRQTGGLPAAGLT